jgi:hypothetical protein
MIPAIRTPLHSILWFIGFAFTITPCLQKEVDNPTIPPVAQEQTHLCWAASDYMVLRHFGMPVRQCDIVNNAYPGNNCCSPSGVSTCNFFGTSTIRNPPYNLLADTTNGSISWSTIVSEINNNRPFIFTWILSGGVSHMMVGVGYHTTQKGYMTYYWVDYNDPFGTRETIRLDFFDHSPSHTTGKTWYNIRY